MSDNKQYNNPPRQMKVLGENSLRLSGNPIQGSKRPPTLGFTVKRDGKQGPWMVFLEVRTNLEGDKDYGRIQFALDLPTAMTLLTRIEMAAKEENFEGFRMEMLNRRYIRQQNAWSKEPMRDGFIGLFMDANRRICIGVSSWDEARPKTEFPLVPVNDFRRAVRFINGRGEAMDDAAATRLYAVGWARAMMALLTERFTNEYVPPEPRPEGQQGGYGGGNRGGNGGYGGGGGGNGGSYGGGNRGGGYGGQQQQQSAPSPASAGGWGDDEIPM